MKKFVHAIEHLIGFEQSDQMSENMIAHQNAGDWETRWDHHSQMHFYYNVVTKEMRWKNPLNAPNSPIIHHVSHDFSTPYSGTCAASENSPRPAPHTPSTESQNKEGFCGVNTETSCSIETNLKCNQDFSAFKYHRPQIPPLHFVNVPIYDGPSMVASSGRRKALLIGIKYSESETEMQGSIPAVRAMEALLASRGFLPSTILSLIDHGPKEFHPNRENLLKAMQWLVTGASEGDALFFHFCGLDMQVKSACGKQTDVFNNAICPSDYRNAGLIFDDELWAHLVAPLPCGVKLTAVMDCYHSGTGLDLPFTLDPIRDHWHEESHSSHAVADVQLIRGYSDHPASIADSDEAHCKTQCPISDAFISAMQENPTPSYSELLAHIHHRLHSNGFSSHLISKLYSTQAFHVPGRVFDLVGPVEPNRNAQAGRSVRRKPRRRWANMAKVELNEIEVVEDANMAALAFAVGFII